MKSFTLFLGMLLSTGLQAQHCCEPVTRFAALGQDEQFRNSHPLPDALAGLEQGRAVEFKTPAGKTLRAEAWGPEGAAQTLLIFHEWWGLNDHIRQEALRLQQEFPTTVIMAVDMYGGRVAGTREEASALMQSVTAEDVADAMAGIAQGLPQEGKVATLGWCFGGGLSLQAALALGPRCVGCVMYYGMPELQPEKLQVLQAPVLFIYGTQDGWINAQVAADFEQAMSKAGKTVTVDAYVADHAFANPTGARYLPEEARAANSKARAFLRMAFD